MSSNNQHKQPRTSRWNSIGEYAVRGQPGSAHGYEHRHDGTRVLSSLCLAEAPDGSGEKIWQWHVSISKQGNRPSDETVTRALVAFDMVGAEEDNHHPGVARHFWMPVDPARRVACECKATEDRVVEPDGYEWTNPKPETGEECRGCELERATGRPCTIHRTVVQQ